MSTSNNEQLRSESVTPSRQKKRQKPGGSFCSEGNCSNRSSRNKESSLEGRLFLRYYKLPKDEKRRKEWTARMKRQFGWVPSNYSKICSDHFFMEDFREEDITNYQNVPDTPGLMIRLKPDAIPCTDRTTGEYRDPREPVLSTRPAPVIRHLPSPLSPQKCTSPNSEIDIAVEDSCDEILDICK